MTIERRTFSTDHEGCEISVVTERLRDGRWAVVAGVNHRTREWTRTVDLPVPSQTFETEAEAEAFGRAQGERWLEANLPRGEAA